MDAARAAGQAAIEPGPSPPGWPATPTTASGTPMTRGFPSTTSSGGASSASRSPAACAPRPTRKPSEPSGCYLASTSRHGIGWLEVLTQAAEGNPWIPDTIVAVSGLSPTAA
jgi:hypothetical protein